MVCKLLCSEVVHLLKFTKVTLQVSQNVNHYVDFRVPSGLHCCEHSFSALCVHATNVIIDKHTTYSKRKTKTGAGRETKKIYILGSEAHLPQGKNSIKKLDEEKAAGKTQTHTVYNYTQV